MEFKSFSKILPIGKMWMSITQKLHGTNAQICIWKDDNGELQLLSGSRSRWLSVANDNYGFANFVESNREDIISKLGEGRHFGEWCGSGINSGEGLSEKRLLFFNWKRWIGKTLPDRISTVPVLYKGVISLDAINDAMERLKTNGSYLVPGFMKPEGVVIELDGQFYKNVFDSEETKWNEKTNRIRNTENSIDISYLLQPLRLEKLFSRDESYLVNYPKSLGNICKDYVKDLEEENQFRSTNEDDLKAEKKELGANIFYFVKSIVGSRRFGMFKDN